MLKKWWLEKLSDGASCSVVSQLEYCVPEYCCFSEYILVGLIVRANKIKVAVLVRVSTLRQETDRQVSELLSYAASQGYEVTEICRE